MRIVNASARLIICAGLDIRPGATVDIPEAYEEAVRASSFYRAGFLQEVANGKTRAIPPPPPPVKPSNDLLRLSAKDAVDRVNAETDLVTLSAWSDAEKRPTVVAAIVARAKELQSA